MHMFYTTLLLIHMTFMQEDGLLCCKYLPCCNIWRSFIQQSKLEAWVWKLYRLLKNVGVTWTLLSFQILYLPCYFPAHSKEWFLYQWLQLFFPVKQVGIFNHVTFNRFVKLTKVACVCLLTHRICGLWIHRCMHFLKPSYPYVLLMYYYNTTGTFY